jgi:hypothetical protein
MANVLPGKNVVLSDETTFALDSAVVAKLLTDLGVGAKAPLLSPVFTGNPTAPTPTAGDNDTSIATTAFVAAALTAALGPLVATALISKLTIAHFPVAGVHPSRPAWPGPVIFYPVGLDGVVAPKPALTGSTSGGGGMVQYLDLWFQPGT